MIAGANYFEKLLLKTLTAALKKLTLINSYLTLI